MSLINANHLGSRGAMMPGRKKVWWFQRAKRDTWKASVEMVAEVRPSRKRESRSAEASSTSKTREFVFMRPEIGTVEFREGDIIQLGQGIAATYWEIAADGIGDEQLDQRIRVSCEKTISPTTEIT